MRSLTVLSLPLQLVFPATTITMAKAISVTDVGKKYGKKVLYDRSLSSSVSWQTLWRCYKTVKFANAEEAKLGYNVCPRQVF